MNQYCRYCVNCAKESNQFYCQNKLVILTESSIKRPNTCRHYLYCDDVITGEPYSQVRKAKQKQMQTNFLSLMEENK